MIILQYFLALLACTAFAWELMNLTKAVFSKNWPTTKGSLDEWDMNYEDDGDAVNFRFRHIAYSYTVRETQYTSNKLGHGFPSWFGSEMVNATLTKVFENSPSLKVHFHPRNPSNSVLTVGAKQYHFFKLFIYAFVISFLLLSIRDA